MIPPTRAALNFFLLTRVPDAARKHRSRTFVRPVHARELSRCHFDDVCVAESVDWLRLRSEVVLLERRAVILRHIQALHTSPWILMRCGTAPMTTSSKLETRVPTLEPIVRSQSSPHDLPLGQNRRCQCSGGSGNRPAAYHICIDLPLVAVAGVRYQPPARARRMLSERPGF